MNCPTCKSENTQIIKMTVMSGTTTGNSVAVGISSHLDLGAAVVGSKTQSNLAASLTPGKKPTESVLPTLGNILIGVGVLSGLLGIYTLFTKNVQALIFAVVFTIFSIVLGKYFSNSTLDNTELKNWEQKNKLFETGWICHKCGHTWTP